MAKSLGVLKVSVNLNLFALLEKLLMSVTSKVVKITTNILFKAMLVVLVLQSMFHLIPKTLYVDVSLQKLLQQGISNPEF